MISCKDENRGLFNYHYEHCGTDLTDFQNCRNPIQPNFREIYMH